MAGQALAVPFGLGARTLRDGTGIGNLEARNPALSFYEARTGGRGKQQAAAKAAPQKAAADGMEGGHHVESLSRSFCRRSGRIARTRAGQRSELS
jgi:hypothetical protein